MKVKIVKCSNPQYWYSDMIGIVFEVDNGAEVYNLKDYPLCSILTEDCEIQNES